MNRSTLLHTIILLVLPVFMHAQEAAVKPVQQKDLLDVFSRLLKGRTEQEVERRTDTTVQDHFNFSILPAVGYTLQTGLAGLLSANATWRSPEFPQQKVSAVTSALTYTQYHQVMWISQWTIWSKTNLYNFPGELRVMKYPQFTYGFGSASPSDGSYQLDYAYLRLYGDVLRQLGHGIYGGLGYRLDLHWGIRQYPNGPAPTDFDRYGYAERSTSSGLAFNLLMDTRDNPINAFKGTFAKLVLRVNPKWMGSDGKWSSLNLDFRKYIPLQAGKQTLALWSYNWLTLSGDPPYLDLPSLGWDINNNTGRGYIQSRFMGKQMLYAEAEYRFDITRNGLFGAVLFANAHGFTDWPSGRFSRVNPGAGGGLRIRLNKKSGTNIAIDYGFGVEGSRGLFVNLGEVF